MIDIEVRTESYSTTVETDRDDVLVERSLVEVQPQDTAQLISILEGVRFSGSTYYYHLQSAPAESWTINHNQGIYLNPTCYNSGGAEIVGEILQLSINTVRISFLIPQSGFAQLS